MPENNKDLPYCTKTDHAHMCGHDGHVACLLAAASIFIAKRDQVPSNRGVRLLFQPDEEGQGGAIPMIKEGCLKEVDEVYGFHNVPNFDEGDIRVVEGPIFASIVDVQIKVLG